MKLPRASALCAVLTTAILMTPSLTAQDSPPVLPEGTEWTALESGLRYAVLQPGEGEAVAKPGDQVAAHYTGWLKSDGSKFDSSYDRGAPFSFTVGRGVIDGWSKIIQEMPLGAKWLVEIPSELGYGERGSPPRIPANSTLLFTIEFVAMTNPHPWVAGNAEAAETIEEGLTIEVLEPGEGEACGTENVLSFHFSLYLGETRMAQSSKSKIDPERISVGSVDHPVFSKVLPRLKKGSLVRVVASRDFAFGNQLPPDVEGTVWFIEGVSIEEPMPLPEFETPAEGERQSSDSGLMWVTLREGEGESPGPADRVTVHYVGRLLDGTVFDSSFSRAEPTSFPLNGVIRGWTEGVGMMKPGEVRVFVIPSDLAYGERGSPPTIEPNSTLVFYIELLSVDS
ncbi:MAG: FKBP-type peptidyl-prolyl cis-trans isomerase [Planctomycetota bacterium]